MTATEATTTRSSSQACDALPLFSLSLWSSILTLPHPPDFLSHFSAKISFGPRAYPPQQNCKKPARRSRERASERARPVRGERAFSMAFKANMVRFVLKLANVILLFLGK